MESQKPHITTIDGKRSFACSPAAVLAFLVNQREEILLMAHPDQPEGWQVINGAMEAGESALEAAVRESYEEAGEDIRFRPLGTVHVATFHYDAKVRYMLSIAYLLAYDGGTIQPGDDMLGSEYRWWSLEELASPDVQLMVPPGGKWLAARAVDLYRLWNEDAGPLRPGFDLDVRGKVKK